MSSPSSLPALLQSFRWGLFARSDGRGAPRASQDDVLGVWSVASIAAGFVVGSIPLLVATEFRVHNTAVIVIVIIFALASLFVGGGLMLTRGANRISARYAVLRAAARDPAVRAGWGFEAEGHAPSAQTIDSTFQFATDYIVPVGMTEVITGSFRGHPFTSGHLGGYEPQRGGRRSTGVDRTENLVIMQLPALLPELRLRDRIPTGVRDYGESLPAVPSGDPAVEARWEVQSPYPSFATDLLDAAMREYLAAVPRVPCTIVFRNGYLISCRDPEGSFESISARLTILAGLVDRIPAICWNRETAPDVAGANLRPRRVRIASWLIFRR